MTWGSPNALQSFHVGNGGLVYEGKGKETITSNAPLRAGKGHLYERGIREPMMIRWRPA